MQRCSPAFRFGIMLMLYMGLACTKSEKPQVSIEPQNVSKAIHSGPVIARVGSFDLKLSEVDKLSEWESEVRQRPPWNLPPTPMDTFDQRLQLAIEFLVLASAAQEGYLDKSLVDDSIKRALASAYLHRTLLPDSDRPVTEEELKKAHLEEIRRFVTTGESELYRPTRVDFAIIGVGINPSWIKYEKGTVKNILSAEQTLDLASKIKKLAGDHVPDLDNFEALAKKFEIDNPTVRIKHETRAALAQGLFPLAPVIRSQLLKLEDNGDLSPAFSTPGGAMILRRGITWPGKGENTEEIKNELINKVIQRRAREHLKIIDEMLQKKYSIETFPDALGPLRNTEYHK